MKNTLLNPIAKWYERVANSMATGLLERAWQERGAGFLLVADGPVGIRDLMLFEEVQPGLCLWEVQRAIAAGIASTPLGGEDGHRFEGFGHLVPQLLLVGVGIEVDRIGQVLTFNLSPKAFQTHLKETLARSWICCGDVHILRPSARTQHDEVLAMFPDHLRKTTLSLFLDFIEGPRRCAHDRA